MHEQLQRTAEDLFQAAADLPPDQRAAFLTERCNGNPELHAEVASLLASLERSRAQFLEAAVFRADQGTTPVPERFGSYRVVRLIGEGGMGAVYEAEQESPRRTVAVKVIRSGPLSAGVLGRFRREAQLLAELRHPGIASVYEAGVHRNGEMGPSLPYIAMEFVAGRPLDEFATETKLGTRERLELVARVCDAVQHAHERGIIHRDLKPANILVDESGQPRILDFGVARAAESGAATVRTEAGQLIGTLSYMSPEQVSGAPGNVDARADVYALGTILFLLLAGRLPHDLTGKSLPESGRMIRDDDPTLLGSLSAEFRGDIETVVAKALDKDRERRYASAAELGADLRRCVQNEPILARPASTMYQLRKFAQRNRALVAGTVAVFVLLVAALAIISAEAVRLERARVRAEVIQRFTGSILTAADPYPTADGQNLLENFGAHAQLIDVLNERLRGLDQKHMDDPIAEAELRAAMALSFFGIGRYEDGERNGRWALDVLRARLGEEHPETLACKIALASNLVFLFDSYRAQRLAQEAVAGCVKVHTEHSEETLRALHCLWICDVYLEDPAGCLEVSERMIRILNESPRPLNFARFVAGVENGASLVRVGRIAAGESMIRVAIAEGERVGSGRTNWMGFAYMMLAEAEADRDDLEGAERDQRHGMDLWRMKSGDDAVIEFKPYLGAIVSRRPGSLDEGLAIMAEASDQAADRFGRDSPMAANVRLLQAGRLADCGLPAAAERAFQDYFSIIGGGAHPMIPRHVQARAQLALALLDEARPDERPGNRETLLAKAREAEAWLRDAVQMVPRFTTDQWAHFQWDDRWLLALLVESLDDQGKRADADTVCATLSLRSSEAHDWRSTKALVRRLEQAGRPADAEPLARRVVEQLRTMSSAGIDRYERSFAEALDLWAVSLQARSDDNGAEQAWREAEPIWSADPGSVPIYDAMAGRYAACLARASRFDAAEHLLMRTINGVRTHPRHDPKLLQSLSAEAAGVYAAWGKPELAQQFRDAARRTEP